MTPDRPTRLLAVALMLASLTASIDLTAKPAPATPDRKAT